MRTHPKNPRLSGCKSERRHQGGREDGFGPKGLDPNVLDPKASEDTSKVERAKQRLESAARPQNRLLNIAIGHSQRLVDDLVGELTF